MRRNKLLLNTFFVNLLFVSTTQFVWAQETKAVATLLRTINHSGTPYWSHDGKTLALKGDKEILLYDATTGAIKTKILYSKLFSPEIISFSPDGKRLFLQSDWIKIFDANDGKLIREITGVERINYFENIFSVCYDYTDYNGETKNERRGLSPDENTPELPANRSNRFISPDWKSVLVHKNDSKSAQVYDLDTGELKFTFEPYKEQGKKDKSKGAIGEFSADGKFIVITNGNNSPRLWNAKTGELIANLTPQSDKVYGTQFSPDNLKSGHILE